jgi:thiol:disulfide interchange protein
MQILPLLLATLAAAPTTQGKADSELYVRADGDLVRVAIEIEIEFGWHLYHKDLGPKDAVGKPTLVTFDGVEAEWSEVHFPEPERLEQEYGGNGDPTWIWGHHDRIVLFALGRLAEGEEADYIEAKVDGLTCEDDGQCIPYNVTLDVAGAGSDKLFANFPSSLSLGGGGAEAAPAEPDEVAAAAPENERAAPEAGSKDDDYWVGVTYPDYAPQNDGPERGLLLWLVFAFIAGMILNVMPCVLPVVSIKILSFVQQAGESRARIFQLGLAFASGIVAVFLTLASLAAFAGQGWGQQFQSQEFLVVMVAVVFAFSLSLFDVFEIGVPQQVGGLAGAPREGIGHAFFMGIMSTILATPCSGPFLGSTLAWAVAQPSTTVFLIFFVCGLGMAFPYVVLTANPGFLKYVPKPGPWMQTFKHLMGFLLLGTVIFLLVSLKQDLLLYTMAFLVFVGMACWVWGRYATFDQNGIKRLGTVVTVLLVLGVGARASFVDLHDFFEGSGEQGHLVWEDFDPDKLEQYHREGRGVMLDFTADWCLTCKTNEKAVYESAPIIELMKERGIVPMKADETHNTPKTKAIRRLRERLGASSIPFMAVFPGDDWEHPLTAKDLVTRGQVRGMLETSPAWHSQASLGD